MPLDSAVYEGKRALAPEQAALRALRDVPEMLKRWGAKGAESAFTKASSDLIVLDGNRLSKTPETASQEAKYLQLDRDEPETQATLIAEVNEAIEKCGARDLEAEAISLERRKNVFEACAEKINRLGPTAAPSSTGSSATLGTMAAPPVNAQVATYAQSTQFAQPGQGHFGRQQNNKRPNVEQPTAASAKKPKR